MEIIRAGIDAWNAGDMDRFRDMYDPNVVLHTVPDWPEPGPYVGREAVMRLLKQVRETRESDAVEPLGEFTEVADHVRKAHIPWERARTRLEHPADHHLHLAQGPDHPPGVLLGPKRSPQSVGLAE